MSSSSISNPIYPVNSAMLVPVVEEQINEIQKHLGEKIKYYANQIFSELKLNESEFLDKFKGIMDNNFKYEDFNNFLSDEKLVNSFPPKIASSLLFIMVFIRLNISFQRCAMKSKGYPKCCYSFLYVQSLEFLLQYFVSHNKLMIEETKNNQNGVLKVSDKSLWLLFQLNVIYLRVMNEEFSEFVGRIHVLHRLDNINSPRQHTSCFILQETNNMISFGSIMAKKVWRLSQDISQICSAIEVLRIINNWREISKDDTTKLNEIVNELVMKKWKLIKKGILLVERTNVLWKSLIMSQLYLFEGGMLVFSNKNNNVQFMEYFDAENMLFSEPELFVLDEKDSNWYEMTLTNVQTNKSIKMVCDKNSLMEWKEAYEKILKKGVGVVNIRATISQQQKKQKRFANAQKGMNTSSVLTPRGLSKVELVTPGFTLVYALIEMIRVGFDCNPLKENKDSPTCQAFTHLIKLLEKKKKIFSDENLAPLKDIKAKDPEKIKEVITLIFGGKGKFNETMVIAYLLLFIANDLRLYILENEKKGPKEIEKQLNKIYEMFSGFYGDKNIKILLEKILTNMNIIISQSISTFNEILMTPLLFHKAKGSKMLTYLGSMLVLIDDEGTIEFRKNDGELKNKYKLPYKVKQISNGDNVLAVTENKLYFLNVAGPMKEIEMKCKLAYASPTRIFLITENSLQMYDSAFLLINKMPFEIDNPMMETLNIDTVCLCGVQNGVNRIIILTTSMEIKSNEEITNNEKPSVLRSDGEYLYIGTVSGKLLKYYNSTLIDMRDLKVGEITGIEISGRNIYVFSTDTPVILVYEKGLTVLSVGTFWGFKSCRTCKALEEKARTIHSTYEMRHTPRGHSHSKSKDKNIAIWILSTETGNFGKFIIPGEQHRKDGMLTETHRFFSSCHSHHWTINSFPVETKCYVCKSYIHRSVVYCPLCGTVLHEHCLTKEYLLQKCSKY